MRVADQSPARARPIPRRKSASATPRQAGPDRRCSRWTRESALASEPVDRGALARRKTVALKAGACPSRGGVQVVDVAKVVLEHDHATDEFGGTRLHRFAHELQGVAEPLGGDPKFMKRRYVRIGDDILK